MKIGLLTTSFPRFEGDVAGSFVLGFARALAARGHTLTVLAPEPRERLAPPDFGAAIAVRYVPYVRPRALSRTFYGAGVADNAKSPLAWPGLVTFGPALAVVAARELAACDALVSHFGVPCGVVASLLARGRPHVAVLHSADLHALERVPAGALLARVLAEGACHVTCVNATARDRLCALLPSTLASRVHVQAMGLDAHALAESLMPHVQARAALTLETFTLLTLARLVPIKGLCEALDVLRGQSELEWIIAGDGPLRAELEQRAVRARARIRVVGEVRGFDKLKLLAGADALLLPSRKLASGRAEGTPLALLEAMACGLPVIASDTGGIAELLEHGRAGMLFDPEQPHTLLAALHRMRAGVPPETIVRAREIASAHDWQLISQRYERWLT
jgi:glycosyltransferase involved in cell wall biosynthesis